MNMPNSTPPVRGDRVRVIKQPWGPPVDPLETFLVTAQDDTSYPYQLCSDTGYQAGWFRAEHLEVITTVPPRVQGIPRCLARGQLWMRLDTKVALIVGGDPQRVAWIYQSVEQALETPLQEVSSDHLSTVDSQCQFWRSYSSDDILVGLGPQVGSREYSLTKYLGEHPGTHLPVRSPVAGEVWRTQEGTVLIGSFRDGGHEFPTTISTTDPRETHVLRCNSPLRRIPQKCLWSTDPARIGITSTQYLFRTSIDTGDA